MAYHRGHCRGTKVEKKQSAQALHASLKRAWEFFGPQGTIADNSLPLDHEAWQVFGEAATQTGTAQAA